MTQLTAELLFVYTGALWLYGYSLDATVRFHVEATLARVPLCMSSSTASHMRSAVAVVRLARYSVELLAARPMTKSHPTGSERWARGAARDHALLGVSFHGPTPSSAPRAEQCACAVYAAARMMSIAFMGRTFRTESGAALRPPVMAESNGIAPIVGWPRTACHAKLQARARSSK